MAIFSFVLACIVHPLVYFIGAPIIFFPIWDFLVYLDCFLFNPFIRCLFHGPEASNTDWFFIHSATDKSIILQIGIFLITWMVIHSKLTDSTKTGDTKDEE